MVNKRKSKNQPKRVRRKIKSIENYNPKATKKLVFLHIIQRIGHGKDSYLKIIDSSVYK